MSDPQLFVTLAVLLVISGTFSATETALFSISPLRLREMTNSERAAERLVARLMVRPRRILVTILLGNLAVNILASALGTATAIRMTGSAGWGVLVATLVMTFVILVGGEVAPKTVAYRHPEALARIMARPFWVLSRLLRPLQWPLLKLTELLIGGEKYGEEGTNLAEVDTIVRVAHSEGEVDTGERDLIRGVIELGSSPLEDVMTPRTEIFSLSSDLDLAEARRRVRDSGFSKIPIAAESPDEMAGFVTALDLLLASDDASLASLVHPLDYVPEVKPALELLEEFQRTGRRLACVVDEYGHLSGLVTLTDLLEEISGEMIERGDLHKVLYKRTGRDRVVVPARMELRFFNEQFGTDLQSEDAETLGGLLLERSGRIPAVGDTFRVGRVAFRVVRAEPNRVVTLEATIRPLTGAAANVERERAAARRRKGRS